MNTEKKNVNEEVKNEQATENTQAAETQQPVQQEQQVEKPKRNWKKTLKNVGLGLGAAAFGAVCAFGGYEAGVHKSKNSGADQSAAPATDSNVQPTEGSVQ